MLPVAGKPVLEHLVLWAKSNGINQIVMLNGFLHQSIEDHFGDGHNFGLQITHSNEPRPLGSGGSVKDAMKHVTETFLLISGDLICKVNLAKLIASHTAAEGAIITALVHESDHPEDSDVLQVDDRGRAVRFVSKKDDHSGAGNLSNAGLFVIEPRIIDFMKEDKFTFETYLFPRLLAAGEYFNTYFSDEYIKDMGTPDRLTKVKDDLKNE